MFQKGENVQAKQECKIKKTDEIENKFLDEEEQKEIEAYLFDDEKEQEKEDKEDDEKNRGKEGKRAKKRKEYLNNL